MGSCERFAQRRPAGPLLVAGHHRCYLRRAGPPQGAWDRALCLRRQSNHVSPRGVHRGRPLQPRPEPVLVSTLPTNAAQLPLGQLNEALAERELLWRNVLSGTEDAMQDLPDPPSGTLEASLPTVTGTTSTPEGPGLHHHLRGHVRASGPASDARAGRLLGLRAAARTWGCRGRPHVDVAVEPAPRCCDGARGMLTRSACAWAALGLANPCLVLPAGPDPWTRARPTRPAARWAKPRGRCACSRCFPVLRLHETEVPGLIPGTDLRPADLLTSALCNSCTALDISICSPHAQEAGSDCNQTR